MSKIKAVLASVVLSLLVACSGGSGNSGGGGNNISVGSANPISITTANGEVILLDVFFDLDELVATIISELNFLRTVGDPSSPTAYQPYSCGVSGTTNSSSTNVDNGMVTGIVDSGDTFTAEFFDCQFIDGQTFLLNGSFTIALDGTATASLGSAGSFNGTFTFNSFSVGEVDGMGDISATVFDGEVKFLALVNPAIAPVNLEFEESVDIDISLVDGALVMGASVFNSPVTEAYNIDVFAWTIEASPARDLSLALKGEVNSETNGGTVEFTTDADPLAMPPSAILRDEFDTYPNAGFILLTGGNTALRGQAISTTNNELTSLIDDDGMGFGPLPSPLDWDLIEADAPTLFEPFTP